MLPNDTSPQASAQQIRLLTQMSGFERLSLAFQLSDLTRNMSMRALRRCMGNVDDLKIKTRYIELHFGTKLAQEYQAFMRTRNK